jgi:hypothetical protein
MQTYLEAPQPLPLYVYEDRISLDPTAIGAINGETTAACSRESAGQHNLKGSSSWRASRVSPAQQAAEEDPRRGAGGIQGGAALEGPMQAPAGPLESQQVQPSGTPPSACRADGPEEARRAPNRRTRRQEQSTHPYWPGRQQRAVGRNWWDGSSPQSEQGSWSYGHSVQANGSTLRASTHGYQVGPWARPGEGTPVSPRAPSRAHESDHGQRFALLNPERTSIAGDMRLHSMQASIYGQSIQKTRQGHCQTHCALSDPPSVWPQQLPHISQPAPKLPDLSEIGAHQSSVWIERMTGCEHGRNQAIHMPVGGREVADQQSGRAARRPELNNEVLMRLHQEVEAFARSAAPTDVSMPADFVLHWQAMTVQ